MRDALMQQRLVMPNERSQTNRRGELGSGGLGR